jgi:hypothetical protein
MKTKLKLFMTSVALFAVFMAMGYLAVKSSSYMDVSQVLQLESQAKVTVKGRLTQVNYDPQTGRLYLLLEGKNGEKLLAIADAKMIEEKYGPIQYLKWDRDNVVLQGIYNPVQKTLTITNILEGCHSSYQQPATQA